MKNIGYVNMTSSTERPAWVSDPGRGGLHAYKHKHSRTFEEHFYGHTMGLQSRRQAAELMEN